MTTTATGVTYSRTTTVTWRDTGVHVLVLCVGIQPRQVLVLSGAGAAIWRLLDEPRDLVELRAELQAPDPDVAVEAALADLVAAGLVARRVEG